MPSLTQERSSKTRATGGLVSASVDNSRAADRSDSSIPSATQGNPAIFTGMGVEVGTDVGVGIGAGVAVGACVSVGAGVGSTRVVVGTGVTEVCGCVAPGSDAIGLPFTSVGEDTLVAESDSNAHGFSIVSVNIANAYPMPTAASNRNARMEIVTNFIKPEPVDQKACALCGD